MASLSDSIYDLSNAVWLNGANITEYLKGGKFLTAQTSLAETDATGTNRDGPPLQATEYFENQFVSALINSYYKENYVYIVYVSQDLVYIPQNSLLISTEDTVWPGSTTRLLEFVGLFHKGHLPKGLGWKGTPRLPSKLE